MSVPTRFRFDRFVLSPRQRLLLRDGTPVPLIPKYLDLLRLLVERRRDAVSKHAIFAEVWSDVIVSDGALSQAVRTLRRTLGDTSREPRFIRTVSRHGYQFVWPDVVEEPDERDEPQPSAIGQHPVAIQSAPPSLPAEDPAGAFEPLVDRLFASLAGGSPQRAHWDEARDAAERLHLLGTAQAMARIVRRANHGAAVAVMRDARWNVPGAGPVPLTAEPAAIAALVGLRVSDARRTIARRWAGASAAGAVGGLLAGALGGLTLYLSPASNARPQSSVALAAIGALAGAVGAAGIGAGLAAAEVLARSRRGLALAACGAFSGAAVAAIAHLVLQALLDGFLGVRLAVAGGVANAVLDGLAIGGAAGIGYAAATRQPPGGGIAAPSGGRRLAAAGTVALFTAAAAVALALSGYLLVGGLVNEIARASPDAQLVLAPLGRLIGEPDFGPITRAVLSAFEGGVFGFALAWGLTRRPAAPKQ